jgi:uncharacterized peroxidase-related enzyme
MSRLTQVTNQDASPEVAELFGVIREKVGAAANVYRVLANQPAALKGLLSLNENLDDGDFDAATRDAIALAVAGANGCDYCASAHTAVSKSLKVEAAEIEARLIGKSSDAKLQAILTFAVTVVKKRGFVSDDDLTLAREAGLDDAQIVETVANVVANIFTNYINHVAHTDIDFPVVLTQAA